MHTRGKCRFYLNKAKLCLNQNFHVNPLIAPISPQNPISPCSVTSVLFHIHIRIHIPLQYLPIFLFAAVVVVAFLVKVLDVVSAT